MAIEGASLIAPTGELASGLLAAIAAARVPAATDGDAVATGYATAGTTAAAAWSEGTTAERDAGARAWAYYLGYHERATQILANEMSASGADEGSVSYSPAQAAALEALATQWRARFDALEEDALAAVATFVPPVASRTVAHTFAW